MSTKIQNDGLSYVTNSKLDSKSSKKSASTDFMTIMDKTLKSDNTSKTTNDNSKKVTDAKSSKEQVKSYFKSKDSVIKDKSVVNKDESMNELSEPVEVSITKAEENKTGDDELLLSDITEVVDSIETVLTDKLGITKEELEKHLEELGFTMLDMIHIDNLKTLVLQVNGSDDITSFLTDENLASTLQDLLPAMEEIEVSVMENITLTLDEIKEVLSQASSQTAKIVGNEPELETEDENNTTSDVKVPEFTVVKETEESTDTQESDLKEDSKESDFETFLNNLSGGKDSIVSMNTVDMPYEQITQVREIVNQIVDKIKVIIRPDTTSMELQLNPENLGKINLSVVMKEGAMTAQFTAANHTVKEVLESQMHLLKETLVNQGLKVDEIEVTVSNFEFTGSNETKSSNQEQQGNSKKRRFRMDSAIDSLDTSVENGIIEEAKISSGTTLDYSV